MDGTQEPMIRLDHVSKRFGDGTVAVGDLSLDVAPGEVVTLIGPSGCGKTTTMKMINRLVEPTGGTLTSTARTSCTPTRSSCAAASAT